MSDLNLTMTEEEQRQLEETVTRLIGGDVIKVFGSIATSITSDVLVNQQKPNGFEERLAALEVYTHCLKILFGVDDAIYSVEKFKAYRNLQEIMANFERQVQEEQMRLAQQNANIEAPVEGASPVLAEEIPPEPIPVPTVPTTDAPVEVAPEPVEPEKTTKTKKKTASKKVKPHSILTGEKEDE